MLRPLALALLLPQIALADAAEDVERAAGTLFDRMPSVRTVQTITDECGADEGVDASAAYCTTQRVILMTETARNDASAAYRAAHAYGHAVQVNHGIADIALRTIMANRDRELELRGWVERQVECIAGVIAARAGHPASPGTLFDAEPFTGIHWGRDPLRIGPQIAITLAARDRWFRTGAAAGEPSVCAVGDFPADLLVAAFRG